VVAVYGVQRFRPRILYSTKSSDLKRREEEEEAKMNKKELNKTETGY
jgi:hypothetical protein